MPITETCTECDGDGVREYLVHHADDEKTICTCRKCKGAGEIHDMTDEEHDYFEDYW